MTLKFLTCIIFLVGFALSLEFKHNVEENIELVEELRNTLELKANETGDTDLYDWLKKSRDGILVNWILNSKKDLKKAETDIIEYVEWRVETDIDNVKEWGLYEDDERRFPWAVTGHDNEGDSVLYFPIGSWPLKEFFANETESNILFQHFLRGCEFAMSNPLIFQIIWKIVETVLSRRALLRVEFLGHDNKALLDHLPAETIPPTLAVSAKIDYFSHKIV